MGFKGTIQMADLHGQYLKIRDEIDAAMQEVLDSARYIKGPVVSRFESSLGTYLDNSKVISCANGTDALQIALMALGLKPGDEVIVPAFTYVATAEVVALLGLKPVMTDVDPDTFNITPEIVKRAITTATKAVVPVHLFGQCADMNGIMKVAGEHGLFVIEDNAQAIGSDVRLDVDKKIKSGTIGHIGTTSFFPSKNLGCYGDGGALITRNEVLAEKIAMIANHGQSVQYHHDLIGVNSRLDALQAAILNVKLKYLDEYVRARQKAAAFYDAALENIDGLITPVRGPYSSHVYHQYTLRIADGKRDELKSFLDEKGIPSMIYYPLPLYRQKAFHDPSIHPKDFPVTEQLCNEVLSLPVHTEMDDELLTYISNNVKAFFGK